MMMNTFRISTKHPDELYNRLWEQEKDRSMQGSPYVHPFFHWGQDLPLI